MIPAIPTSTIGIVMSSDCSAQASNMFMLLGRFFNCFGVVGEAATVKGRGGYR